MVAELKKSPKFSIYMFVPGRIDVLTINEDELNQMEYKRALDQL